MPASKTILLLGLAAFLVVSAAATEDGSGLDDTELDAFLSTLVATVTVPEISDDFDDDYDAVGNYADQDAQDQLDSLPSEDDEPSNSLSSSNDEEAVDSGQMAAIVILSLLIVVALGVAAFYLKKTQ